MARTSLRILCVHGVGRHPPGGAWEDRWKETIAGALEQVDPTLEAHCEFAHLDEAFHRHRISFWDAIQALGKLVGSAVASPFRRARGLGGSLRWTAGMVVQWVENETLRKETRDLLAREIAEFEPDVICAHSLGSLVAYDAFTAPGSELPGEKTVFVSFGSQIGNAFVAGNFLAGRIEPLRNARHWYHLYNEHDDVFAAPIRLYADNYEQVETPFDEPGVADHTATRYLGHAQARHVVWARLATERVQPRLFKPGRRPASLAWAAPCTRRALLVGINDYPRAGMRLEGCVNDVYLMSALLQEQGFAAEDIRVVLDDRATAKGILDRLEWLLDRVGEDDERVFYFSGHGAQLPTYGLGDVVDRMDETLVSHDFDWSHERAVTDDRFHDLYSQLPYGTHFLAIFDCCHSGGMTREGARIRGIDAPDDVRHRALRWDADEDAWVARDFEPPNETFAARSPTQCTHRLGHAMELRELEGKEYDRVRKKRDHFGPYMPLLLYACREDEYAYEYRHGNISYGAFTYTLAQELRARRGRSVSFEKLAESVARRLARQRYDQHPVLEGPSKWREANVPMLARRRRKPRK